MYVIRWTKRLIEMSIEEAFEPSRYFLRYENNPKIVVLKSIRALWSSFHFYERIRIFCLPSLMKSITISRFRESFLFVVYRWTNMANVSYQFNFSTDEGEGGSIKFTKYHHFSDLFSTHFITKKKKRKQKDEKPFAQKI